MKCILFSLFLFHLLSRNSYQLKKMKQAAILTLNHQESVSHKHDTCPRVGFADLGGLHHALGLLIMSESGPKLSAVM